MPMIPPRTPHSTPRPPEAGGLWMKSAPERLLSGSRWPEQGCRRAPIRPGGPQNVPGGLSRSAVGVAGAAPVADRPRALLPGREVRPEHVDDAHRAVPELLVEASYDGRREQPQLGGPGRGV